MPEYVSPAEFARLIRTELKSRHGWTSRQVSVKSDSYSMGSSIDITIKAPGISIAAVEEIANGQERIHRCEMTGEILGGGNRFVSVSLDWEMVRREAAKLVEWVKETPIHDRELRIVEVCGEGYYIGRTGESYFSVSARNNGFIPTGSSAEAVAGFFASRMLQAGVEVVPPSGDGNGDSDPDPDPKPEEANEKPATSPEVEYPAGALQLVEEFSSFEEAQWALSHVMTQDGLLGARALPAGGGKRDRLQAFFEDDLPQNAEMSEGMRRVIMPRSIWPALQIPVPGRAPVPEGSTKPATTKQEKKSTSVLVDSVKAADEDFEWYPTTSRMVEVVCRHLDKHASSILDIGAGDGRVLKQLAARFEYPPTLYSIEKSTVLIQAQPESVVPVGTDLFEQNLACLPVDYIFCNPPYSQYDTWACMVIESGYARKSFLVIPSRWIDHGGIQQALKKRGATARVIHTDDFLDAPRKARAVVDIVEISYPKDKWGQKPADPFDTWFDENISTFDEEKPSDWYAEQEAAQRELARVRGLNSITEMCETYREEYERMEANYRAIFELDYALLKELGVNKEAVREGIKKKMAGLKAKYWQLLFERLSAVTDRLSTATKTKFLDKLLGQAILAFTESNAYAVVLWAIKNANCYLEEQTVALYKELSTFDGAMNYKSNQKTWKKDGWRYILRNEEDRPTHYALDYRIVLERYRAIGYESYDYINNLARDCHNTIADVIAVLFNLGFPAYGARSQDRLWHAGEWQDWYRMGNRDEILFQVKGHKNGNLHFRFLPAAIKALNVEAGRLLGWLRDPGDVVEELEYTFEEAGKWYGCIRAISTGNAQKLLGAGSPG